MHMHSKEWSASVHLWRRKWESREAECCSFFLRPSTLSDEASRVRPSVCARRRDPAGRSWNGSFLLLKAGRQSLLCEFPERVASPCMSKEPEDPGRKRRLSR
ncbi:hypothetical protein TGFOU_404440 [Toxoplasma gondii FOU]|uniref:Uncharacterized protein n=1 Tax=Toxoplasma gondii FOU TaxID=943167 RepID=A0A086L2E5_TOXGO|nr:hypothetical protein TGFOU_404440 [Toxoplasma gondii FOU]